MDARLKEVCSKFDLFKHFFFLGFLVPLSKPPSLLTLPIDPMQVGEGVVEVYQQHIEASERELMQRHQVEREQGVSTLCNCVIVFPSHC
jgi:hypothetical protein